MSQPSVAVVGGGWSGIAAAWYLQRSGARVVLFDQGDRLGGRSASAQLGSRAVTLGGKNIGSRYHHFRAFARALAVDDFEHFGLNSSRIEDGRVRTVDSRSRVTAALGYLRRTPATDALRLLRMAGQVRAEETNRFLGAPTFTGLARRTGDPALAECFGPYLRASLIRPMTVRMNGAEPDEIHLGTFGTNLGMLLDSFDQLRCGFEPLFAAFRVVVPVRLGTRVQRLLVDGDRVVGLAAAGPGGEPRDHAFDAVVVALPAPDAAALLAPVRGDLADVLREVRYFPAAVAVAEYARPVFSERMRALVFPADSPLSNAGAYGIDDRHIVRYTFSGRAARPCLDTDPSAETLLDLAEARLGRHVPVNRADRREVVSHRWRHALCGYGRLHAERIDRLDRLATRLPGLVFTGDYLRGASIEACFRASQERVAALTAGRGYQA
jgi:oxygen-dependent protoporphyrinogen oxidase